MDVSYMHIAWKQIIKSTVSSQPKRLGITAAIM